MKSSMAWRVLLGGLALGLAACGGGEKKPKLEANLLQPDCYTVDPYQPIRIATPSAEVPENMKAFLGAWGGGAWDGSVCHDLWVMEVGSDGKVLMFDAHGPGFFPDATAFTRKGVIAKDGRLHVRKGSAQVEYWIEDGRMYGERKVGKRVQRIIMARRS